MTRSITLAIEGATYQGSVAVIRDAEVVAERTLQAEDGGIPRAGRGAKKKKTWDNDSSLTVFRVVALLLEAASSSVVSRSKRHREPRCLEPHGKAKRPEASRGHVRWSHLVTALHPRRPRP